MPENVTGFQPTENLKKSLIDLVYFDIWPRRSPTFFREEPHFVAGTVVAVEGTVVAVEPGSGCAVCARTADDISDAAAAMMNPARTWECM
jgi:hypothetical protein